MNPDRRILTIDSEMLRQHWRGIRNAGAGLLVLGALAVVLPLAAAVAIDLLLGWLLLLSGVVMGWVCRPSARRTASVFGGSSG